MRITKVGHSCLLLEDGTTKILADPGKYSFRDGAASMPDNIESLNAILITHGHADHADPEAIKKILGKNKIPVYGNAGVKKALAKAGIPVEAVPAEIKIGGIEVRAIDAPHAPLLQAVPENTAYLFNGFVLLTGDSLAPELAGLRPRVLIMPGMGPFMGIAEAGEFAKSVNPEIMLPVHDGYVNPEFLAGQYENWKKFLEPLGIRFVVPELGKTMQF